VRSAKGVEVDDQRLARIDVPNDPVLGLIARDESGKHWLFNLLLPNGRAVPAVIVLEDDAAPPTQQVLGAVRERVRWLRDNEPVVRDHITKKMYDLWLRGWCDQETDPVTTRDQFRERIWLASVTITEDRRLSLHYNDALLFGGQALVQSISASGKFDGAPDLWG
jgi:hypothetical protein